MSRIANPVEHSEATEQARRRLDLAAALDALDPGPDDDDGEGLACCDLCGRSDDHDHPVTAWGFPEDPDGGPTPDELEVLAAGPPWAGEDDRAEWLVPRPTGPIGRLPDDCYGPDAAEAAWATEYGRSMAFAAEVVETTAAMRAHVAAHGGPVLR